MTKKQLRKAKRVVRKHEIKKLTFVGKLAHYLGGVAYRIKNVGYETEMNRSATMGIGTKYHYEVTEITFGFHPLIFLGYICFCVFRGLAKIAESLMELSLIDKSTRKVKFIDYYDKNKKANG